MLETQNLTKKEITTQRNVALGTSAALGVLFFADTWRQKLKSIVGLDESVSTDASAGGSGEQTVVV